MKKLDLAPLHSSAPSQLSSLSKNELLRGLFGLVAEGRTMLVRIIRFLAEVERRDLHSELACASLWDFCVRRLRLSEDAASRYVAVARLGARFPLVLTKLESGDVHLTGIYLLRHHLRNDNHEELLTLATHKTKRQIEDIIAERFPRADLASDIRLVTRLGSERQPLDGSASPPFSGEPPAACDERTIIEALSHGRHRVELTVSSDVRTKLDHARDLMRHRNPTGDLAVIVEKGLDLLIAKLEKERFGKTAHPRTSVDPDSDLPPPTSEDVDYVPAAIKRVVAARDGYQCTFVNEAGERCPGRSLLEYDHVIPKARGGETTVDNVRLLCHPHNLSEGKRKLGAEFIEQCIHTRQTKAAAKSASPREASVPALQADAVASLKVSKASKEPLRARAKNSAPRSNRSVARPQTSAVVQRMPKKSPSSRSSGSRATFERAPSASDP